MEKNESKVILFAVIAALVLSLWLWLDAAGMYAAAIDLYNAECAGRRSLGLVNFTW